MPTKTDETKVPTMPVTDRIAIPVPPLARPLRESAPPADDDRSDEEAA